VLTPAEVEAKLDAVAAVLARLGADLVFLQEVENEPLLARLAARAGYPGWALVDGLDPRGIDVAVLSRLPLLAYVSHLGEFGPDGAPLWSRDCVEVHASAGARRLVLVGSHLASKVSDPSGVRRGAQAARMREIVDGMAARFPGAAVVAGGDLNDDPWSVALAALLADGALLDSGAALAPDLAWTWSGAEGTSRLDYLLLAHRATLLSSRADGGADVAVASDHRPVVVDLWIG
jgi:endonuclease/exonuclease/phosphatase family metal-dependent hydrolase